MDAAAVALQRSPYYARKGGRDHLLVSNTFRVVTLGSPTANRRGKGYLPAFTIDYQVHFGR